MQQTPPPPPPPPPPPRVAAATLAAATSVFVALASVCMFLASAMLVVAATLSLTGVKLAPDIVFECGFVTFAIGIGALMHVGLDKVVAHRRGGRAHLEHDVRRTLARLLPAATAADAAHPRG